VILSKRDEYAQEFYSDESINVNCVLSWRLREDASSLRLRIDFHNSFFFDSERWHPRLDLLKEAIRRLKTSTDPVANRSSQAHLKKA
jgi:hypothetical protein